MSGLEDKWKDKVVFLRKGIQENGVEPMMDQLRLDSVPSVVILDGKGNEVERFVNVKSAEEITSMLKKATGQ